jgi:hypothetical protein
MEDIGPRLPFEQPYWTGKRPLVMDDADFEYPFPFNPLEMGDKTFRTAQQLEQYGPDGSLQKTGTISVEHRLLDEVVLNDGPAKKVWNAPSQLDAHGNWTKLTRWQTDSHGTRPLSVAYRTLTYY